MKTEFSVGLVSKTDAARVLDRYHYLSRESKGFKSGFNCGLFFKEELVGVCIFTGFPVPELAVGMLGLKRHDQEGLFELSRLCLTPDVQRTEHNLASWFVGRSLSLLRKSVRCRAVLSYADDGHHTGTVYQACNFWYYGLSAQKKDFWARRPDGRMEKCSRGRVKGVTGEWRPRTRKHRYLIVYDPRLVVYWDRVDYPRRPYGAEVIA